MKIQYRVYFLAQALALLAMSIASYGDGLDILGDSGAKNGLHLRLGLMLVHVACLMALAFFSFNRSFLKALSATTLVYTLFLAVYIYKGVIDLILVSYFLCSSVLILLFFSIANKKRILDS
jgi:hypothetical protein